MLAGCVSNKAKETLGPDIGAGDVALSVEFV